MLKKIVEAITGEEKAKREAARKAEEERRWAVFVEYHERATWAVLKARAGGQLNPQAVEYMQTEIDRRRVLKERRESFEKEMTNAKPGVAGDAADADANGYAGAPAVGGPEQPSPQDSQLRSVAGLEADGETGGL